VTSQFSMFVVDNVIAMLCDWVMFLDYWNGRKWDITIEYLTIDSSEKILWSNNGQLINGLDVNNWISV